MPKAFNTSPQGQQTISSFFSRKRKGSPIDLTAEPNELDEFLPAAKRIKEGNLKFASSSSRRDSASPADSSRVKSPAQGPGERHLSVISTDDSVSRPSAKDKGKGKGKGKGLSSISSREKPRRMNLLEEERRVTHSGTSQVASPSASKDSEEDDSLPWKKGASRHQKNKSKSVIGPQGLPCTPLEEAVSLTDHSLCLASN